MVDGIITHTDEKEQAQDAKAAPIKNRPSSPLEIIRELKEAIPGQEEEIRNAACHAGILEPGQPASRLFNISPEDFLSTTQISTLLALRNKLTLLKDEHHRAEELE